MLSVLIIKVEKGFIVTLNPNEKLYRTDMTPVMISYHDGCARWETFGDELVKRKCFVKDAQGL
jgi:hypothetical protein